MIIYMVVISHKYTKQEYTDSVFIHEDNAEAQLETISQVIPADYEIHVEPIEIKDWDEGNN